MSSQRTPKLNLSTGLNSMQYFIQAGQKKFSVLDTCYEAGAVGTKEEVVATLALCKMRGFTHVEVMKQNRDGVWDVVYCLPPLQQLDNNKWLLPQST